MLFVYYQVPLPSNHIMASVNLFRRLYSPRHGLPFFCLRLEPPPTVTVTNAITTKDELLAIIDHERAGTVDDHLQFVRDPYLRRYAQPDGPNLTISDRKEDIHYPSRDEALRGDPQVAETVKKLRKMLNMRLKHPGLIGLRAIYAMYCTLPTPRMLHLPATLRHRLLKVLGTPKRRNSKSMLRFFAVIGEVQHCGLTLRRREWNAALALASQYVSHTTDTEAEATLRLWNEMERNGGEKGNGVTFNILFDAASKSGNFALAEKIYGEMVSRGIQFNRYHHVSLIHFFGLKKDEDGIRAAYKEMVDAGEMIDTVVLNCLIASFLRAGDEAAALRVYDYMKSNNPRAAALPATDYRMSRVAVQVLMMFGKVGRNHPSMRPTLQEAVVNTPDLQTYRILLNHYGVTAGNLNRVVQFLDEMKWFDVPVHGAIFLILFKAFTQHGGRPYLGWTEDRLRSVFSSLLHILDNENGQHLYIDTWLAGWALRAFLRCSNKDAVLDAYDELKSRWELPEDRVEYMEAFLHRLLSNEPESGRHDSSTSLGVHRRGKAGL
ncbi:pentatricopeptide repeat-containing protein [Sodiomyces alkalinus F11]|uniref:Pentatricopeptide repeat-containing protein n=1 Tax=Sodiomyces alkalinus (strain CBS 110278 / VKM F-3762 / F11) TaxID=1314773 RepID=A0A3N2PL19_SODAK|nr:pentatricopeptide repeat-containing protein [Sodiomyces alkalinus F11]ROT35217.1 pentatricopeptide repeat-containing protein [Sodiomyces alkalinus F11]